jgi:5'-nucleotidase|tara:strand:+ start:25 stop:795 length:771 start_codon:yes stop_codon:yes gene_type:complete
MGKPLILVTNDDGIDSRGIRFLVSIMKNFGEVVVVAPDSPQSGMGHAITVGDKLRLVKSDLFGSIVSYKCSGTPADCVKIAKHHLLKTRKIDLITSGINHGSNSSISVLYSGTMSAAIEGAIENTASIGFSLCDFDPNASLSHSEPYINEIINNTLKNGLPEGVALNVNIPSKSDKKIKGIKICKQANAYWEEIFDKRLDPYGREYYWMVGNFVNHDKTIDNDELAITNNYVSIVPCKFDLTSRKGMEFLKKKWNF